MALSFFEEMSISVLRKHSDEDLLKDFFYTSAVRFMRQPGPPAQSAQIAPSFQSGRDRCRILVSCSLPIQVYRKGLACAEKRVTA